MKNEYELSALFCSANRVVIIKEDSVKINFGFEEKEDLLVRKRIEKSVSICFKGKKTAFFSVIGREAFAKIFSGLFEGIERKNFRQDFLIPQVRRNQEESRTSMLLDNLFERALSLGASDIHIEECRIRFRIMGSLEGILKISDEDFRSIVQRIKFLAELNVAEKRRCQDGQFVYEKEDRKIFVRVSCVPSISSISDEGESLVLRLLDPLKRQLDLFNLGFGPLNLMKKIEKLCLLKAGLVLICGSTGSGKSTTAMAMLKKIKELSFEKKKLVSLEDPVEYVLDGVTQIKIDEEIGMGFSQVLRRVLRQDPDVIFIGEIRDELTARTALQSALTGHLVIGTLHCGNFEQAFLRLIELGEKKEIVKSVLKGVIFQSLENGRLEASIHSCIQGESV